MRTSGRAGDYLALISIGPTETMHFQIWSDKASNGPPLTAFDPVTGLSGTFPDLSDGGGTLSEKHNHARAVLVLGSKPPHLSDHSTYQNEGRCHGRCQVSNGHGAFHWPIASVLFALWTFARVLLSETIPTRLNARFRRDFINVALCPLLCPPTIFFELI
jgi:hypothetical protein